MNCQIINQKIIKILVIGGIIFSAFFAAIFYTYVEYMASIYIPVNSTNNLIKVIKIEKGWKTSEILETLRKNNLIKSSFWLKIYLRRHHLDGKLQAGDYKFYSWLSPFQIIQMMAEGKTIRNGIKITIPEGFTLKQIDQRLSRCFARPISLSRFRVKDFQDQYDFLKNVNSRRSLQGFLFPDTYFFDSNIQPKEIAGKMLDNFSNHIRQISSSNSSSSLSFDQAIILASIIEKEVQTLADKKIVAGVFLKRLRDHRPLESCATIAYILGKNKKQYSLDDLRVDSPFNTYLHLGLPPEPICNPGLDSISAVLSPQETDYNYFLTDPATKKTIFSRTLTEHQRNKKKYLR